MKIRHIHRNLLLVWAFLFFMIPFVTSASVTIAPQTSGSDNLIGTSNATWVFTSTTTASLVNGDVVQFSFPDIQNAPPFGLNGVSLATSSGITLYSNLSGQPLSNKLLNPSFETATSTIPYINQWNQNGISSSTIATSSVSSNGSVAVLITSHTATNTGQVLLSNQASVSASAIYTVSFYTRGGTGGEYSRFLIQGDGSCGADMQLYNFASSTFGCVTITPSVFSVGSPYVQYATTTNSYSRITQVFQSASDMTIATMSFVGGGDVAFDGEAVYYDAVQLESGTSSTAFNLGGTSSPTLGVQGGPTSVFAYVNTNIASNTPFSASITGVNNAKSDLNNAVNVGFGVKAGTLVDTQNPTGAVTGGFLATTSTSLIRAGGGFVTNNNSSIVSSSYGTGSSTSFTFTFTSTSSIPNGGKIVINFPLEYSLNNATVTTQTINTGGVKIVNGDFSTLSNGGENRVLLQTSNGTTSAGDMITVTVSGLTNPATAGVYRPFYLFTTLSNDGLLDGSYFGFEESDFSPGAPPPVDAVHIGGTNILVIDVKKESGTTTIPLTGNDLTQVKVGVGCPDKQFFVGERWLDSNSQTRFNHILDCNYFVGAFPQSTSDDSFYNSFLPPGMKQVQVLGGGTTTATVVFGVPDATSTVTITGGVPGANAYVMGFSEDYQTYSDIFTDTTYTTSGFDGSGVGYARMRLKSGQTWNFTVESGSISAPGNFSSGGSTYWPPQIPDLFVDSVGSYNLGTYAYISANNTLTVSINKTTGGSVTDACLGVKRSGGGLFMDTQDFKCQPDSGNDYTFKVPVGSIVIELNRPGFGAPEQYPVGINASSTTKVISVSAPTSYILIAVNDVDGNPLNGAPVFAFGSNGAADAMTGSTGTTTLYLQPGTYIVEGFAPGFGSLTSQTKTVTNSTNPTVTFTVDVGNLRTVSGTVTQGGQPIEGIKIGAHGINDTNGGNGTETGADGTYTLYLPAGDYLVGGWSPDTGGLPEQSANVTSGNVSGIDWTLGGGGTLRVTVSGGVNVDPLFAGAFDPTTGRGNGVSAWSISGQDKTADIILPAGIYAVHVGSPITGELTAPNTQATITAGNVTSVSYSATTSADLVTLSGSVTNSSSTGIANVAVWASRVGAPGFYSSETDNAGSYSLTVPDGRTYNVGVRNNNYVATGGDVEITVSGNSTQNFTLSSTDSSISGMVLDSNSSGISNAWVSAKKIVGNNEIWTGAPTDDSGAYSLNVDSSSNWTLYAEGPCYLRSDGLSATAGDSSKNFNLQSVSGCQAPVPQLNSVTPAAGGQVSEKDMTLNIPANALGSSQSSVTIRMSDADLSIGSANATPLSGSVKSITVTDGSGQSITSLNSNATLALSYDPADLPVGFDEADLQLGYFDETTGAWEPVAGTVDIDNNLITARISHFTDYGPILPGVPTAPDGISTTADSSSQITVSWTASPSADYYKIYRSLTNSSFTTSIGTTSATSYADTSLSVSTAYYYEVAGVNGNGEGQNSTSTNVTTDATSSGSSSGGGHIVKKIDTTVDSTEIVSPNYTTNTDGTPSLQPSKTNTISFEKLTQRFSFGDENEQINTLQRMLASDPSIYPKGLITGYYGMLTVKAIEQFQIKYNIVSAGTPDTTGFGDVGPRTLAKLNEVFVSNKQSIVPLSQLVAGSIKRGLSVGMEGSDVYILQQALNTDSATKVAESGFGSVGNETTYFGPATLRAVQSFQIKYGLAKTGDTFFGFVGPQTRAKLNEIIYTITTSSISNEPVVKREKIIEQIKFLTEELNKLKEQLKVLHST